MQDIDAGLRQKRCRQQFLGTALALAMTWIALPAHAGVDPSTQALFEQALASLRSGRTADAYGRFATLADYGHAEAARFALWMYEQGPARFGSEWDSSPEQLAAWAALAGRAKAPSLDRSALPAVRGH